MMLFRSLVIYGGEGNAEPINEGFEFHLDAEVNNRPSHSIPCLVCRQFSAEKMADQGGGDIQGIPCLYLFTLPVTHRVGTRGDVVMGSVSCVRWLPAYMRQTRGRRGGRYKRHTG